MGMMDGKVVLVTGAGRGVGRGIAMEMAGAGAAVVVNDLGVALDGGDHDAAGAGRSESSPAERVVAEIAAMGGRALANHDSVADWAGACAMVKAGVDRFGRIDAIVNNAGNLRDVLFHKMSPEDFDAVLGVHLNGSFNTSRAAAPFFREQASGAFVHMTSTSGLIGNLGQANYAAAKMGIVGLSKSIAIDMQRFGVRSNAVAPFAWTRMVSSIPNETPEQRRRVEGLQKLVAEKIAPFVVALCGDEGAGVTGQIFGVRNNEIYLFSQPRPIRTAHTAEGWTPEAVASRVFDQFASDFYPLDKSGDIFTWTRSEAMAIRPDQLLAHDFGALRQRYVERDAILYALGIGLGSDPTDRADLAYLDETRLAILPTFAVTLGSPGMWLRDPRFGVTFGKLVHSAQDTMFHTALPPRGDIVAVARVASICDRGEGRGARLVVERDIRDADTDTPYATVRQTLLLRGDGGYGGASCDRPASPVPARAADLTTSIAISSRAALIYRLSGDRNPLHVDPDFATAAGFERPIMHGLGTYAAVGLAVARALDRDPQRMRRLACTFAGVVFPGDTLAISIWRVGDAAAFVAHVGDRTVIDHGWLELPA